MFIPYGYWRGNEADIYCESLFNLMKPDGMQLAFPTRADAQRFETLEWQWFQRVLSAIFHLFFFLLSSPFPTATRRMKTPTR
jgi:hypothetical protein